MFRSLLKTFSRVTLVAVLGHIVFILVTPYLTRIYSPQQFGIFAIFISVSSLFSGIAAAKLELVLAKLSEKKQRVMIVCSSVMVSLVASLVLLTFLFFLEHFYFLPNSLRDFPKVLYLVPVSVLLISWSQLLSQFVLVHQKYKVFASSKLLFYLNLSFFSIFFGFSSFNEEGLILAHLFSTLLNFVFLLIFSSLFSQIIRFGWREMFRPRKILRTHRHFIRMALPADFFANISNLSLPILLAFLFSVEIAGLFMLAQRILSAALNLIGNTVGQIFIGEVSKFSAGQKLKIRQVYLNTTAILFCVAISFFVPIYLLSEKSFLIIFGSDWGALNDIFFVLIPMFFLQLVFSPTSNILLIIGGENLAFALNFCRAMALFALSFLSEMLKLELLNFLVFLVILSAIYYCLVFVFPIRKLNEKTLRQI